MPDHLTALPSPDAPRNRARILLVDDVPANLLALEAVLAPLEQELVRATSGDEALKHLLHEDFALILMDVQMPGLDGLETAQLIRSRERTRHIPIIFITALSREAAYVTRGYAEGGVDYLLKPVDPDILRAKVRVFVELYLRGEQLKLQAIEIAARRRAEEELQRASELEQQLVGIVGHDIRTPLSAIRMTAQSHLASGELDEPRTRAFERVERSADRIAKIVDVLLDFTRARIGGGIPVVRRHGDLQELCRRVMDEFHTVAPDRKVECSTSSEPVWGDWDFDRLGQVLSNLVDNALKYGTWDGTVRISLEEDGEGAAVLKVTNDGPPIPADVLPTLFEPFRRADPADGKNRTSLGLGLYIARELVRAHGGSIRVQSSEGAGTSFVICLPTRAAASRAASPCPEAAQLSA